MLETRTTVRELTTAQRQQAYEAWQDGHNVEWVASRFGVFPADMREWLEEERKRREANKPAPARLNDALFDAIAALEEASRSGDVERIEAEVKRAKATEAVGRAIIANMALGLEFARVSGGDASVPKAFLT